MRIVVGIVLALGVVVGCKSSSKPNPTPNPTPTPDAAVDLSGTPATCAAIEDAYAQMVACEPSAESKDGLRAGVKSLSRLWEDVSPATRPMIARSCALMLGDTVAQFQGAGCAIVVAADIQKIVDAERTRRTTVPTTGDAAVDAALKQLADLRDQACACADRACVDAVELAFDAALEIVSTPPPATREAIGSVIEELGYCTRDTRTF